MRSGYLRVYFSFLVAGFALVLTSCVGPQGPPGPAGPPGSSSGGGPPYEWVCTPISIPKSGGNSAVDLSIFNGGANTANIAVHILNEAGTNLSGHNIPGTNPVAQYPGQTGSNTVTLAAKNTLHVEFQVAQAQIDPSNIGTTVHVTSDTPIAVGINIQWGGEFPRPCTLLPK